MAYLIDTSHLIFVSFIILRLLHFKSVVEQFCVACMFVLLILLNYLFYVIPVIRFITNLKVGGACEVDWYIIVN